MDQSGPYRGKLHAPGSARPGEHRCPACLRAVKDDARACPSCATPIATLRCGGCFHMNLPEATLCQGCGQALGLEPIGEPDALACPDCKLPFQAFGGEGGLLRDCGRCGGQFVDHALCEALLARRERYGSAAPAKPIKHNPLDSPVRYLPCPVCSEVMMRKNFGQTSGVIVDVCRHHGIWFDCGELPRVLAFVEAGGLELARQREQERQRESERRDRVAAAERQLGPLSAPVSHSRAENAAAAVELAQASAALLGFVRDLLRTR
jgi:Zn-finger nucleic acid-binding protein